MPSRMIPFAMITLLAVAFMWATKGKDSKWGPTELPVLEAEELIESWQGHKLVLVNFWATWCEPCEKELPDLVALQRTWKDKGLAVSLVNMEHPDSAAETLKFLRRYDAASLGVIKPPKTEKFFQTLGFEAPAGLPISGLWSPDQGLISYWAGVKSLEELDATFNNNLYQVLTTHFSTNLQ